MRWKVAHTTLYDYADVVPFCQNIVYLAPRSTPFQTCSRHRLIVSPHPTTQHRRLDYFGNQATILSVDRQHKALKIAARSTVEMAPRNLPEPAATPAWEVVRDGLAIGRAREDLANYEYAFPSNHVPLSESIGTYVGASFAPGRPILEALGDVNHRVYSEFEYDPKATTVTTPVSEVFEMRRGVCQDLSHVLLSGLRSLGLAARYVSGYLRTYAAEGQSRLRGCDASHAWISVYCGELGWIDVDPTNDLFPSTEHITVAWGRDFGDVCPVSGMFIGGGEHQLTVSVDVSPAAR